MRVRCQNRLCCRVSGLILASLAMSGAVPALAQDWSFSYDMFGGPGMIDMPVAISPAEGTLALNASNFRNTTRYSLTFQVTDRLSAGFRYSLNYNFNSSGSQDNPRVIDFLFDRSFGLHYRLANETRLRPAIAVGVNDFLGTGRFASEYLVATKTFGDIRATAGLGWGRFAGVGGFDNPLGVFNDRFIDRPARSTVGLGGQIDTSRWFRGDAAVFGGIEWQATDRLRLTAEYSSDDYPYEDGFVFDRRSPYNFGLSYAITPTLVAEAHYIYGSELALQLSYAINPRNPQFPSGLETAPLPVVPRDAAAAASWGNIDRAPAPEETLAARTARALGDQGVALHGLRVSGDTVRIEIENRDHAMQAQAIGRTARALTRTMPAGIETFEIVLIERGMPVTQTTLRRADVEELEHDLDGAWLSYTRARIGDAALPADPLPGLFPRFDWGLQPYAQTSLFDPDDPLRIDFGLALLAQYELRPGLIFSGELRQPIFGNLDQATRPSTSPLPRVRSESNLYDKAAPALTRLTGAYYFRPGDQLFGRVTVGYLEPMFGGLSTELLWYPTDRRFALGAEVNHVVQRDFDQLLGFRDYEVTTGHVSAYLDLNNGFTAQLDAGRYLAGDWGATLSLDRQFENGWRVGAFATLTDVPFDDFGEGSFDKGIRVTVPINWVTGQATRDQAGLTIRPVLRDGGARLDVDGRLFEVVHSAQGAELRDGWGRFWR